MSAPSPAFALLAACCRWPDDAAREGALAAAAARTIDWGDFERLVARHRVLGLAAHGLRKVPAAPEALVARLGAAAARDACRNLMLAAESVRVVRAFAAAGLAGYLLKGAPLALLAYGDAGLKQSRDIDVVVPFAQFRAAIEVLEGLGYVAAPGEAPLTQAELDLVRRLAKHRAFRHAHTGLLVELHFRFSINPHVLPSLAEAPPLQEVAFGGAGLVTLAPAPLYAYLCDHGGGHGWSRLKWLADLAALVRASGRDGADLHQAAVALGAGRASAVALLLCHDVLGLALPEEVRGEARASRVRLLARLCRAALADDNEDGTRREGRILRQLGARLLLAPSGPALRTELALNWASYGDRQALALPPHLAFLYPLLRVPRAALRIARRRAGR